MEKKVIGVIGGMGPIATSHYIELIIRMTDAKEDQDHLDMIIYNTASVPDRTSYILDPAKPSPLPDLIRIGKQLEGDGADYLCMPCVTAHYFAKELCSEFTVPFINILTETAAYLQKHSITKAGIMATDGTVQSGLFQDALLQYGITPVLPSKDRQKDIMHLIYHNVKEYQPVETDRFQRAETELKENGAEVILLGCTELSLVKRDTQIGSGFLDVMDVLAQSTIRLCGGKLKEAYENLIT